MPQSAVTACAPRQFDFSLEQIGVSEMKLTELNIYPIKSCRGISLQSADLTERGLRLDRRWMVVREDDGVFVSQREHARLALVQVTLDGDGLRIEAQGRAPIELPIGGSAPRRQVKVWEDVCPAIDEGDPAARWFSEHLNDGGRYRLVRFPDDFERRCNPAYAGESGAHTAFADGYPLLVTSVESLSELNAKLALRKKQAVPMARFRPNLVIEGLEAGGEDRMAGITLRGGEISLAFVKPCSRCVIITRDQGSGEAPEPKEPTQTLATYRRSSDGKKILFGQNAIILSGVGETLRLGEAVARLDRSAGTPILS